MKIVVTTQANKKFSLTVKDNDTVEALKLLVEDEEGVPSGNQRLQFKGVDLENQVALSRYGISEGSEISLIVPTRGIVSVAVDVTKQKTEKTGKNDLLYWSVSPGFNYGGRCLNRECKAFDQPIMFSRGFGIIVPTDDENINEVIKCPGCKCKFDASSYFFYKCQVEMVYKKDKDKDATVLPPKIVEGDDYWKLGGDTEEKSKYLVLKFTVKELGK